REFTTAAADSGINHEDTKTLRKAPRIRTNTRDQFMGTLEIPFLLRVFLGALVPSWLGILVVGCAPQSAREVIVYTSPEEEFSRPMFAEFTRETGVAVRAKFDVESTKSVALTQAIMAERERPRCDLFWNNEVVNTLRLEQEGLLAEYDSPVGREFPPQ